MLGAAYQAKLGLLSGQITYEQLTSSLPPPCLVCQPYNDASEIYDAMVARYRNLEATLLS